MRTLLTILTITATLLLLTTATGALLYGQDTDLNTVDERWGGYSQLDGLGRSVAMVGDVNGDGYDDFMASAMYNDDIANDAGKLFLYFGQSGSYGSPGYAHAADATLVANQPDDQVARSFAGAGDVNGDGLDDIVIGVLANDTAGINAGQVYLVFGRTMGWSKNMNLSVYANASYLGESPGDVAGLRVDGVGDVNGDGLDDVLIGAILNDEHGPNRGQAYLVLGKTSGWSMNINISQADASWYGEHDDQFLGNSLSAAGDVNGDNYDDFIIGSPDSFGGKGAGYLFLGGPWGWGTDNNVTSCNASFIGEATLDSATEGMDGIGDINGDGYGDIGIGAPGFDFMVANNGKVYIIFGKATGWTMNVNLSTADCTYVGNAADDGAGGRVRAGGDIDGDRFDDFLVSAWGSDTGGTDSGAVYVILGSTTFSATNSSIAGSCDASFIGQTGGDNAGMGLDGNGDVNRDGLPEILVGAPNNDHPFDNEGRIYLIYPDSNTAPTIHYMSIKDSPAGSNISSTLQHTSVYIEVVCADNEPTKANVLLINVSRLTYLGDHFTMKLYETTMTSGVFVGWLDIDDWTRAGSNTIAGYPDDLIWVMCVDSPGTSYPFTIDWPAPVIDPVPADVYAQEDSSFNLDIGVTGGEPSLTWDITNSAASWLSWDGGSTSFSGTPTNIDVGYYAMTVNVSDAGGQQDSISFGLTVNNTTPSIYGGPLADAYEDLPYSFDLSATDEGDGPTVYTMTTEGWTWVTIDNDTGELSGTPTQADVGTQSMAILFDDGKGGMHLVNMDLTVLDTNDPPVITGEDNKTAYEDIEYVSNYIVTDPEGENVDWGIDTNATWLSKDPINPGFRGTPTQADIGSYYVNFIVTDERNGTNSQLFTLTVVNTNDRPFWQDVPGDASVLVDTNYIFDVNATDEDIGEMPTYTLTSTPSSDIGIDGASGFIIWKPTTANTYHINISASDGKVTIYHEFVIDVIDPASNLPPYFNNSAPRTGVVGELWTWTPEVIDPEGDMVTLSLTTMPTGMTLSSGVITWTPTSDQVGVNDVTVRAEAAGQSANNAFTITVTMPSDVNNKPDVNPVNDETVSVGDPLSVQITASDLDGDNLTYSVEGPDGMTISQNGLISWTPGSDDVGNHTVTVTVSDGLEDTVITFTVSVPAVSTDGGEDGDGGGGGFDATMCVIIGVIAVVLLLLIIVIIVVMVMRSKKQRPVLSSDDAIEAEVETDDIFKAKDRGEEAKPVKPVKEKPVKGAVKGKVQDLEAEDGDALEAEIVPADEDIPVLEEPSLDDDSGMPELEVVPDAVAVGTSDDPQLADTDILALPPARIMKEDESEDDFGTYIDEILIMSTDGVLLDHYARSSASEIDRDILSGMLSAVQGFVKESFTDRDASLRRLEMRDFTVLIEPGKHITVVGITSEKDNRELNDHLLRMMREIDKEMAGKFKDWDGCMDSIREVDDYVQKLLEGGYE